MELIIKLFWKSKETENTELSLLNEYDENTIKELMEEAYEKKTKSDKIDIVTAIKNEDDPDEEPTYKHYYFDNKHKMTIEQCLISVSVKQNDNKKIYSFDDKVNMLSKYLKENNKLPEKGTFVGDFDVGAFYQQMITSGEKVKKVDKLIEKYAV